MITIFKASTILEEGFNPTLIALYYDSEKEKFEKVNLKISKEFTQGLSSGYNTHSDVEQLIENINEGKETLTKKDIQDIYDDLFINVKGQSLRYKVSTSDQYLIKAKELFLTLIKDRKDLGV